MGLDSIAELFQDCQDTVDYVTLEELRSLPPSELLFLELPPPQPPGRRYRCMARSSLNDYAATSAQRLAVKDEAGETGRVLMPTYLPGVDLEERDFEFLVRCLDRPQIHGVPMLLHVEKIVEAPAQQVLGAHETSVHIYELAEAHWERSLWQIFDLAALPATTTCPSGHPLRQQPRLADGYVPFFTICDQCERMLIDIERYRCTRGCDFDLCRQCYGGVGTGLGRADGQDRVEWLEKELATFWKAHAAFVLPPHPPREGVHSPWLSTALTKWNKFNLGSQEAPSLRHSFLRSLHLHGTKTEQLSYGFWPGCAEQWDRTKHYIKTALCGRNINEWHSNAVAGVGAAVRVGDTLATLARQRRCLGIAIGAKGRVFEWQLARSFQTVTLVEKDEEEEDVAQMADAGRSTDTCNDVAIQEPAKKCDETAPVTARLVSGPEAMNFHAQQLALELDPTWSEKGLVATWSEKGLVVELLEAVAASWPGSDWIQIGPAGQRAVAGPRGIGAGGALGARRFFVRALVVLAGALGAARWRLPWRQMCMLAMGHVVYGLWCWMHA